MRGLPLALLLAGCGPKVPPNYDASLFALASGFAAKEACSCLFVAGRSEEECAAWVRVSPDVARFHVDAEHEEVRARALGMGRTVARWVDARTGCVLVDE